YWRMSRCATSYPASRASSRSESRSMSANAPLIAPAASERITAPNTTSRKVTPRCARRCERTRRALRMAFPPVRMSFEFPVADVVVRAVLAVLAVADQVVLAPARAGVEVRETPLPAVERLLLQVGR